MGSLDTYSRNPEEFLISPSSQEDLSGGGLKHWGFFSAFGDSC